MIKLILPINIAFSRASFCFTYLVKLGTNCVASTYVQHTNAIKCVIRFVI